MTRLVFLHGLEGSHLGTKARYLAQRYDVLAPPLDTGPIRPYLLEPARTAPIPGHVLAPCLAEARAAIAARRPEVLVGSSFGGGLAAMLSESGDWSGPLILFAPAAFRLGVTRLSTTSRVAVIHGTQDDIIPVDRSIELLSGLGDRGRLDQVEDDHRLTRSIVEDGRFELALAFVRAEGVGPPRP